MENLLVGNHTIIRNGFKFIFSCTYDMGCDNLVEDTYGKFTDHPESKWTIRHMQGGRNAYAYFDPSNMPTVQEVMDKDIRTENEAIALIRKYAQENYERACSYGDSWNYHFLICNVYLDQPDLDTILMAHISLGGIDDIENEEFMLSLMDEQIHEVLPEAMLKCAEYAKAFSELRIVRKDPKQEELENNFNELEQWGWTVTVMHGVDEIDGDLIRRWVTDSIDNYSGTADEEELGKCPVDYDWIRDNADALAKHTVEMLKEMRK